MKILIVGPAWVGDMVIAHALVRTLLAAEPAATIDVLAPDATAPLCGRMPGVADTVVLPVRHGEFGWRARRRVGHTLRRVRYDRAIVLPNSFKAALVPFFAKVPLRTGWRGEWRYGVLNDVRTLDAARYPRLIDRFVALGAPVVPSDAPVVARDAPGSAPARAQDVEPQLTADPLRAAALPAELGLATDAPILALCPGAQYGPAKRWPAEHYAAVAAEHVHRGGIVWLFGAPGDAPACAAIRAALPPPAQSRVFDLAGRTQLLDAVDLLSLTAQVVTNDSGLMHVACALGVPVVAIYGSSSPAFTPPLSARARVVRDALPCSPCFARTCPLGHTHCLTLLRPERVVAELLH
jgi:heptosyltransferase-2